MSEIAALLDDTTQAAFREALGRDAQAPAEEQVATKRQEGPAEDGPRPETLAALAVLGRQAVEIRAATLTVMTAGIRFELQTFGYVEPVDAAEVRWRLTEEGTRAAESLAATLAPSAEERQEARSKMGTLLDEVRKDLGPID